METLKIISMSILFAVLYGICHDLITAHISVEYFAVGHPIIIDSNSPVMLALVWGVIATWWVGLILGILISLTARIGQKPRVPFSEIVRPMFLLMMVMAGSAFVVGIIGYVLARSEVIYLVDHLASQIEADRHPLFLAAGWAHGASYIVGFLGGIVLCFKLWQKRKFSHSEIE